MDTNEIDQINNSPALRARRALSEHKRTAGLSAEQACDIVERAIGVRGINIGITEDQCRLILAAIGKGNTQDRLNAMASAKFAKRRGGSDGA